METYNLGRIWLFFGITVLMAGAGVWWLGGRREKYWQSLQRARAAYKFPLRSEWPEWAQQASDEVLTEDISAHYTPAERAENDYRRILAIERAVKSGRHPFSEEP